MIIDSNEELLSLLPKRRQYRWIFSQRINIDIAPEGPYM